MVYCGSFIGDLYDKLENNPISISLEEKPSKIDKVIIIFSL